MHSLPPLTLPGDPSTIENGLYSDLLAIGGHGISRVAATKEVVVARMTGEDMTSTYRPASDILLVPASPCRMAVRVSGSGDRLLRLCPNTLLVLRAGQEYDIQYLECERFLAAAVDARWFDAIAADCNAQNERGPAAAIDTVLHPDIPPIVGALRRHLAFPQTPHERFLQLNVELLISHYFWHQTITHFQPPLSSGLSNGRLQAVLERIEGGLEDRILVADLARDAQMTASQFSRSFKAKLGTSPQSYILERRVIRVQDLLEVTSMPLAEMAYETGFSSQAHMTATFAKHFGITPGEYRKYVEAAEDQAAREKPSSGTQSATAAE